MQEIDFKTEVEIGKEYGYCTVLSYKGIEKHRRWWICKCRCGNICVKSTKDLLHIKGKCSCGCAKIPYGAREDITGQKIFFLTAIRYINCRKGWLWQCECGKQITATKYSVTSGNTKSCGCYKARFDTKVYAEEFNLHTSTIQAYKDKYFGKCIDVLNETQASAFRNYLTNRHKWSSEQEKECTEFVRSIYSGKILENDRVVCKPRELDIYLPEKKVAIEIDGIYWHSTARESDTRISAKKTNLCAKQNIRLIHIYDIEWNDKKEICKSIIKASLGIFNRKIFARNCIVQEVSKEVAANFLDKNHIQGNAIKAEKAVGLFYHNELVQLALFGTARFAKNKEIELYRMATLLNTQVVGGFSKLMKHSGYEEVISFVSKRLFNASGYYASNWKIIKQCAPSFCLVKREKLYSRHLFKKNVLLKRYPQLDASKTEQELEEQLGFYRLYDCGTIKVIWRK